MVPNIEKLDFFFDDCMIIFIKAPKWVYKNEASRFIAEAAHIVTYSRVYFSRVFAGADKRAKQAQISFLYLFPHTRVLVLKVNFVFLFSHGLYVFFLYA